MRTVLFHCFGLRSGSVYADDFEGNRQLESYVGHVERQADDRFAFAPDAIPLIKAHGLLPFSDHSPSIYVVRDGRDACHGLWHFFGKRIPLRDIITGRAPGRPVGPGELVQPYFRVAAMAAP